MIPIAQCMQIAVSLFVAASPGIAYANDAERIRRSESDQDFDRLWLVIRSSAPL
jgi:hypothetical protein